MDTKVSRRPGLLQRLFGRAPRSDRQFPADDSSPHVSKVVAAQLGDEVLGRYRAEFKDDYVLFLLSFNTYTQLVEFGRRLSFIHGPFEEGTTEPSMIVMVLRFTDREFCLIIGGQLEKAVCRELIARCEKAQVNYQVTAANESSWYAHELRRTLIDLKGF